MQKIVLEIHAPFERTEEKIEKAIQVLSKATKKKIELEHGHDHSEPTPYKALRELTDKVHADVQNRLLELWGQIVKKWLRLELSKASEDDPFKLNGKLFINPETGKVLTRKEWKSIQNELTAAFSSLYGDSQEAMVRSAMAMGKLINQMNPDSRLTTSLDDLNLDLHADVIAEQDLYEKILAWADVHTGELITDMTDRSRKAVVETIMQGYQDGITAKQLRTNLFDQFSTLNRDWRRIAETETATNFNDGYLTAELENKKGPEDYQFMIGISGAGACNWCQTHVNNNVVVLLENPPAGGDKITIDGKEYTAIWPGKNNFGRKRANWWVASGSQHPHCRCTWTRYYPEYEKYERKLRSALAD